MKWRGFYIIPAWRRADLSLAGSLLMGGGIAIIFIYHAPAGKPHYFIVYWPG